MDDASTVASSVDSGGSTVSEIWCILNIETSLALLEFLHPADLASLLATDFSNCDQLYIAVFALAALVLVAFCSRLRGFL